MLYLVEITTVNNVTGTSVKATFFFKAAVVDACFSVLQK
jgi:hypothetical protein